MTSQQMRDKGYFNLFGDIYRFLQVSDSPNWDIVVNQANKICHTYQGTELGNLSNGLVKCIVDEIERINK